MKMGIRYLLLFLFPMALNASTYYVDSSRGNDLDDGQSPGTPWKTMARVISGHFEPADSVLFKRGETWREQLRVPASGQVGKPITFGAYGTGERPVFTATDSIVGWTQNGPGVWTATLTTQPKQVFFDGERGKCENSIPDLDADREWFWTNKILHIYSKDAPSVLVEASVRPSCITLNHQNHLTFENIHVWGANETWRGNIDDWDDSGTQRYCITVRNCELSRAYEHGLRTQIANAQGRLTGFEAYGNLLRNNGVVDERGCGIHLIGTANDCLMDFSVHHNEAYANKQEMIGVRGGTGGRIFENYVHDGGFLETTQRPGVAPSSGILIGRDTSKVDIFRNRIHNMGAEGVWIGVANNSGISIENIRVFYNVISATGWQGIHLSGAKNCRIYNNLIYDSEGGLVLGAHEQSTGIEVKNNIFCSLRRGRKNGNVELNRNSTLSSDHNIWDPAVQFHIFESRWNAISWEKWQSLGHDVNGFYAEPQLADPTQFDFTLQDSSPAVDSGVDLGLSVDFRGQCVPLGVAPDIGAFEGPAKGQRPTPAKRPSSH